MKFQEKYFSFLRIIYIFSSNNIAHKKERKKQMKRITMYSLLILCVTLIIAVIPTEAEGAIYEDTVRLHILANSNSDNDQELKLKIRDDILSNFSEELNGYSSTEDAKAHLSALLPEIESFAEEKTKEYGYSYEVKATLSEEWYDTREYEDFTLPKGYYTSLRIIIGDGEGKNWWCVMYPPLCLDMATETAPADDAIKKYNENEYVLISKNGYNAKFKVLELVSSIFS